MILLILAVANSLLHLSKDIPTKSQFKSLHLDTSCTDVNISMMGDYQGIVKSGYLKVNRGQSALAFIFYGKKGITDKQSLSKYPTILWLNGGPGSSSQMGNLMQLGPFKINNGSYFQPDSFKFSQNNQSWVNQYNVLFVDQPVGTGLSYADQTIQNIFVNNMTQVAKDFYEALKQLYNNDAGCFKQLNIKDSDTLFIVGESYAGKYVPAIAAHIVSFINSTGFLKGMKGIAIGDAFIDPLTTLRQMGSYASFMSLIDNQQRAKIQQLIIKGVIQARNRNYNGLHDTFQLTLGKISEWAGGANIYDIRKFRQYDINIVNRFFNSKTGQDIFKFSSEIIFDSQKAKVYEGLFEDFMRSYVLRVEYLLLFNIPVLIYSGQDDLIVQTAGCTRWVQALEFKQSQEFRQQLLKSWKVNNITAGMKKKAGPLEYRIVFNSGHLVPMDQPAAAFKMIKEFIDLHR